VYWSFLVLLFGILGVLSAEDTGQMGVADLLRLANGSDPGARMAATRELFRRGAEILPALEMAGARPMQTISPPRGDVIYTLLQGLHVSGTSSRTFGLHIEGPVTRDVVQEMGRRHGFSLEPYDRVDPHTSPTCYVRLFSDKELPSVLKEILLTEPSVKTVNLDHPEHSGKGN